MARDFAKKRASDTNRPPRRGNATTRASQPREGGWSWFFSGLFSGLFLAFIAYLALDGQRFAPEVQEGEPVAVAEQAEDGRGTFDFYQYLPNAEVQVDVVPVEVARSRDDDDGQYLLQAGSFQNSEDAQGRRASVILLNLDARVVPGMVAGKTWHRVQVGPFSGRRAAEEAREILSSNNIDTIVLKLR